MICQLCQLCQRNPINAELQTLSKRSVCLACATAIAEALPHLKTQPCRRQTICMRLQEQGLSVMPTRQEVRELVDWGVSNEQLQGACDIARERGKFSFGYVYSILKNEREQRAQKPPEPVEAPKVEVRAKEEWERQGFASQADYDACDHAYTVARFKNSRLVWVDFRRNWISPAV